MRDTDYKNVNTVIRTYESSLLSADDYERLLKAADLRTVLDLLKSSVYDFSVEEVLEKKNFDGFLMKELARSYREIAEVVPDIEVVELFTLRYTYHNLKVLLKQKFTGENFSSLLIPIGRYSLETLTRLVETGESDAVHPVMEEAVRNALADFTESSRIEAAIVYMDTYYFRHLRAISDRLDVPAVTMITDVQIDLYNLSAVVRGLRQQKSRAFLHTILSSAGTIPKQDIINDSLNGPVAVLRKYYAGKTYGSRLEQVIDGTGQTIDSLKVDKLADDIVFDLVSEGLYQPFGPLPVLGYLYAKEKEVQNLRLILVGKDNGIAEQLLRERMRLIYGS